MSMATTVPATSAGCNPPDMQECTIVPSQRPQPPQCCENHHSFENGDVYLSGNGRPFSFLWNDDTSGSDSDSTKFWDLAITIYLPVILVWFRRSMFGSVNLVRSIVVGHLLRFLVTGTVSEWMTDKTPSWLQTLWMHSPAIVSSSSGASVIVGKHPDPHAWPSPALSALALLTIFTLVVHPDGLTWIILGKLRDTLRSLWSVLSGSLDLFMDDYGILPTVGAICTLAALLFLCFIVLRTLSRKEKRPIHHTPSSDKKKKKKKGNHSSRKQLQHKQHHQNDGIFGRTKPIIATDAVAGSLTGIEMRDSATTPFPAAVITTTTILEDASTSTTTPLLEKETLGAPAVVSQSPANVVGARPSTLTVSAAQTTGSNSGTVANTKRSRIASVSTLDTTVLTDDQSCGSTSVRSYPSVSVGSTRSVERVTPNKSKSKALPSSSQGNGNSVRRGKRGGGKANNNIKGAIVGDHPVSSRWDALKPDHATNVSNGFSGSNGNVNRSSHHHHSQQIHGVRNSCRRGGNGSHGRDRNGRPQHSIAPPASDSLIARLPTAPSLAAHPSTTITTPHSKKKFTHSYHQCYPSSSGVPERTMEERPTALATSNVPPPPPGFQTEGLSNPQQTTGGPVSRWEDRTVYAPMAASSTSLYGFAAEMKDDRYFITALLDDTRILPASSTSQAADVVDFFASSAPSFGSSHVPFGGTTSTTPTIQENPFSSSTMYQSDLDSQIEAELQELGGQMAGSILDF